MDESRPRRALGGLVNLLFAFPLYAAWTSPATPSSLKVASAALLILTAVRPVWSLLVLAGFAPLLTLVAAWMKWKLLLEEATVVEILVASFLVAGGVRVALGAQSPPSRLARPIAVFAWIVATSAAIGLAAQQQATTWPAVFLGDVWRHLLDRYTTDLSAFYSLHTGAQWLEGLALAVLAERLIRQDSRARAAIVPILLTGATAAAVTSWVRAGQVLFKQAQPFSAAAIEFVRALRLQTLYQDPNAAASVYALYVVAAVWLAVQSVKRNNLYWLAVVAISVALWLPHSRAAQGSAVVVLAGLWVLHHRKSRITVTIAAGAAIVLLAYLILSNPQRATQSSAADSIEVRSRMTRIALRITAESPIFGVGIGQFQQASRAFITEDFIRLFPPAVHGENAHNNFLQILADLGVVGFVAFLWILAAAARPLTTAVAAGAASPAVLGLAGGVLAFLVSCLAGHPLLIAPVLWLFMLVLGVTTGLAAANVAPSSPSPWAARLALALTLVVLISAPVRVWQLRRTADLDHVVIGAGKVMDSIDGEVYRVTDAHSMEYTTSTGRVIEIPLRLTTDSTPPCLVHIALDGRAATAVQPSATEWSRVRLQFERTSRDPLSRGIEFQVDGPCHLMVGKFKTRE